MTPAREAGNGSTGNCRAYSVLTCDTPAGGVSAEVGRLLVEALRCLKGTDLEDANAALKRANAEVAYSLPPGYALDASDPDVLLLLRADGTTAAAFSARGASTRGIMEAAEQDVHPASDGRLP